MDAHFADRDKYGTLLLDRKSRNLRCVRGFRPSIGASVSAGFLLRLDRAVPQSEVEVPRFFHDDRAEDQVRVYVDERRVCMQQGQGKSLLDIGFVPLNASNISTKRSRTSLTLHRSR